MPEIAGALNFEDLVLELDLVLCEELYLSFFCCSSEEEQLEDPELEELELVFGTNLLCCLVRLFVFGAFFLPVVERSLKTLSTVSSSMKMVFLSDCERGKRPRPLVGFKMSIVSTYFLMEIIDSD